MAVLLEDARGNIDCIQNVSHLEILSLQPCDACSLAWPLCLWTPNLGPRFLHNVSLNVSTAQCQGSVGCKFYKWTKAEHKTDPSRKAAPSNLLDLSPGRFAAGSILFQSYMRFLQSVFYPVTRWHDWEPPIMGTLMKQGHPPCRKGVLQGRNGALLLWADW